MANYVCFICKKEFQRFPSQVLNPEKVCCSTKCYGERQSIEKTAEKNANYKNGNWVRECKCECGRLKDSRSKLCAKCARKSFPKKKVHRRNNNSIRKLVLEAGLIEYGCAKCNIGPEWMGEELTLQLDHINGDCNDDRLENLRFLCPNCHSQTPTWGTRNRK